MKQPTRLKSCYLPHINEIQSNQKKQKRPRTLFTTKAVLKGYNTVHKSCSLHLHIVILGHGAKKYMNSEFVCQRWCEIKQTNMDRKDPKSSRPNYLVYTCTMPTANPFSCEM